MKKIIYLMFCCVFLLTSFVFSQSRETGSLIGIVSLEDGSPIPGVLVKIKSDKVLGEKSTITNNEGRYRLSGLPPGTYTMGYEGALTLGDFVLSFTATVDPLEVLLVDASYDGVLYTIQTASCDPVG